MIEKGTYNATPPTLTDGQKTDLQVDFRGNLLVADGFSGEFAAATATAIGEPTDAAWDGVAASATVIALLKAIAINTTPA
jgi:hypothetical protein